MILPNRLNRMASPPNTLNLVIELIRTFMQLERDQVVLYNQNWKVPTDDRLYIAVAFRSEKPYGSSKEYMNNEDGTALVEVISFNSQETYTISVYSFGPEALERKEEVLMAFNSTLAEQIQEKYGFKLPLLPLSFLDLSDIEGASRLNRYETNVAVLRVRSKTNIVQYFDQFENPPKNILINP